MGKMAMAAIVALFLLSSCGQANQRKDDPPNTLNSTAEMSDAAGEIQETQSDQTLENLVGEYEYLSDNGTGKLTIEKTTDGYDISDYESEASYRFLADSSNIEAIENHKIYIKYPEEVFSDDTVVFSYYILEYGTDEIDVYYGESGPEETRFLYHAVKKGLD